MDVSRQEEIIGTLWAICAVLAFGFDFSTWGWIFAIKAATDHLTAIYCAVKEILAERHNDASGE